MAEALNPQELEILDLDKNRGEGLLPIPSERDREIAQAIEKLRRLDLEQLKSLLDTHSDRVCMSFAERMAALAVRRQSRQDLNLGIVAAGIARSITQEPREVIIRLAPLWHSAILLGLNAREEFLAVALELGGMGGELLESFTKRTPHDQSLEVMGYVESQDDPGFRYRRTW